MREHRGFHIPAWKPAFYPKDVPSKKFLEYYATRLNSVEVNYTFRQLPSAKTLEGWLAAVPGDFAFACKAHMRLTHIMKMKDAGSFTEVFLKALEPLRAARRLGPVLYQFAPTFKLDLARLDEYLPLLPNDMRFAFEFRHASWLTDAVYERLGKSNMALVAWRNRTSWKCRRYSLRTSVTSGCAREITEKKPGAVLRTRCVRYWMAAAMSTFISSTRKTRTAQSGLRN